MVNERRTISQINPETHLSEDYTNEYNALMLNLYLVLENPDNFSFFMESIHRKERENGGKLIRKYQELYGPDSVDESNEAAASRLDSIADEVNTAYAAGTLTVRQIIEAAAQTWQIIKNRRRNIPNLQNEILDRIVS